MPGACLVHAWAPWGARAGRASPGRAHAKNHKGRERARCADPCALTHLLASDLGCSCRAVRDRWQVAVHPTRLSTQPSTRPRCVVTRARVPQPLLSARARRSIFIPSQALVQTWDRCGWIADFDGDFSCSRVRPNRLRAPRARASQRVLSNAGCGRDSRRRLSLLQERGLLDGRRREISPRASRAAGTRTAARARSARRSPAHAHAIRSAPRLISAAARLSPYPIVHLPRSNALAGP